MPVANKVLVAGSVNMDLVATVSRLPLPGETLSGEGFALHPGGKGANQAVAAAKLGAATTLMGCVGEDAFGQDLRAHLLQNGVTCSLKAVQAPTGTAMILVDAAGENSIVVTPGANGWLDAAAMAEAPIHAGDVLVSQLEVPVPTVAALFKRGRAAKALNLLNAAPAMAGADDLWPLADIVVVNEVELACFAGAPVEDRHSALAAAVAVRRFPQQAVVVTLGRQGVLAIDGDQVIEHPGHAVRALDATGAGDCFVGALATRLCAGDGLAEGLAYANKAAAICVQRPGAGSSMPTLAEVEAAWR
ncbi:MAG: ribokinase [Gammaproteobacteria bacterium]|nr:ribokinase [Gammaproteobacteria bacterium]